MVFETAIATAITALGKEAISQYGKYRTEKERGKNNIIVACIGLSVALIAVVPKTIEMYKKL